MRPATSCANRPIAPSLWDLQAMMQLHEAGRLDLDAPLGPLFVFQPDLGLGMVIVAVLMLARSLLRWLLAWGLSRHAR